MCVCVCVRIYVCVVCMCVCICVYKLCLCMNALLQVPRPPLLPGLEEARGVLVCYWPLPFVQLLMLGGHFSFEEGHVVGCLLGEWPFERGQRCYKVCDVKM